MFIKPGIVQDYEIKFQTITKEQKDRVKITQL